MKMEVFHDGRIKIIDTNVNVANCFKPEQNPTKMRALPLIYSGNIGELEERVDEGIGTIDKVWEDKFVMRIMDLDSPIYSYVFDHIDEMKLSISKIAGGELGYMFILKKQ